MTLCNMACENFKRLPSSVTVPAIYSCDEHTHVYSHNLQTKVARDMAWQHLDPSESATTCECTPATVSLRLLELFARGSLQEAVPGVSAGAGDATGMGWWLVLQDCRIPY